MIKALKLCGTSFFYVYGRNDLRWLYISLDMLSAPRTRSRLVMGLLDMAS